ncbi:MAG TPA: thioredoxin family protein [Pseudogracilibacillus sp.]|nr:thioredoxin family protein [Pseudogracilibacillus sp.]
MKDIAKEILQEEKNLLLFIHTPFCGTCHVARSFLTMIEDTLKQDVFYDMNGSFYEDFLHDHKIESVPCLYIRQNGEWKEKIYTFHSIQNIYAYLLEYAPYLFAEK